MGPEIGEKVETNAEMIRGVKIKRDRNKVKQRERFSYGSFWTDADDVEEGLGRRGR